MASAVPAHIASALGVREITGGSAVDSLVQHFCERPPCRPGQL
jgi:RNA polymerase-interacting CarD/CdnL/TRCF family regulator